MDLIDELVQTGKSAIQKTKEYAESVKITSRISDEERKLNGIYQQIGKQYCSLHSESCEPEFSELLAEVKKVEKNIAELREQMNAQKRSAKCQSCGSELPPDAKFCAVCGTAVSFKQESEKSQRFCPQCGAPAENDDLFCAGCGMRL